MIRIYLAGSFSNTTKIRFIGSHLRQRGFEVYCFCDEDEETYRLSIVLREELNVPDLTPKSALDYTIIQKIGRLNWHKLIEADVVVVVLPSGRSAHLEAGYMKGKDGRFFVYGPMVKGEFDAMYVMANGIFDEPDFEQLCDAIAT